ncbi:MAG: hypothetical protein IPL55_11855 [Saprospiraceae bacterium]|jgi:hypothetical protein|nr:hypothetical protein [Saprospiraceae bacterium]MBL0024136.1 hypothetical protein [Saprospiraceae bacterium]
MAKYILEQSGNINWMGIFALITFFTIFAISVVLAFKKDNQVIKRMERLPLDDDA